jgi:hypothetical protein
MKNNLDIVNLIENNPVIKLNKSYQSKLINKIKSKFNTDEQQLFVSSFYCYLNYKKDDYCIDLDDIWEWLGFTRRDNSKKSLCKNFAEPEDYKILQIYDKICEENFAPPVGGAKNLHIKICEEKETRGGFNKEQILMKVDTFKAFCLIAKTKKGKEIRNYFLKLEETLYEVIDEESNELRQQLENKEIEIKEQKNTISRQESRMREITRRKTLKYEKKESVYIGTDCNNESKIQKSKIGNTKNQNTREITYRTNNPDFQIKYIIPCNNYLLIESIITYS